MATKFQDPIPGFNAERSKEVQGENNLFYSVSIIGRCCDRVEPWRRGVRDNGRNCCEILTKCHCFHLCHQQQQCWRSSVTSGKYFRLFTSNRSIYTEARYKPCRDKSKSLRGELALFNLVLWKSGAFNSPRMTFLGM